MMRLILLIIAVVSVKLFFKSDKVVVEPIKIGEVKERHSDYSMADFTIIKMNALGKPHRILSGSEMSHYPDDDSIEVINQISHFIDEEDDTWLILSDKGRTLQGSDQVQLTGNVIITRPENKEIELYTERLHIDMKTEIADTDLPVRMVSPSGVSYGTGLDADFKTSIVKLHSKVRGIYESTN